MCFFKTRSNKEWEEIFALAQFISDYNIQKGSIDERYLPYVNKLQLRFMMKDTVRLLRIRSKSLRIY